MRTNTLRALAVVVFALLAGCDSDTASTAPRAIDPDLSVSASRKTYVQIERLANPLVSEVMVLKARHPAYNFGQPSTDVAAWTGDLDAFTTGVAGRSPAYASAVSAALLPDMLLVYPNRDGTPVFWLSWAFGGYGGRSLPDDVVDTGLGVLFGDLLGNPNNVTPGLTTDNVPANDAPFRSAFPYLAQAH